MSIIYSFDAENSHGKSPWVNKNVLSLILFVSPEQNPKIKYAIWLQVNILR